jgi:L-iditol 2-dehydrogenase
MFDIPKTMRAVVYRGANDLRLETVPVPAIGPNELLVKVAVCGVCPTDIKKIHYGLVTPPRIFGHETAGTIVKIGGRKSSLTVRTLWTGIEQSRARKQAGLADVGRNRESSRSLTVAARLNGPTNKSGQDTILKIGDRVALHHHIPCTRCHFCRHRAFAQCAAYKRTGVTAGFEPAGGGYAEYVRVMPFVLPGVVKIPPKNTFEEAAMLEPLNTVLKALNRLNLIRGDRVLVAGQGPIGLMFTKLLKLRGVSVLATDLLESRLKLAKKFGAKWILNLSKQKLASAVELSEHENREGLGLSRRSAAKADERELLSGLRLPFSDFDAAIIAVPSDDAVQQSIQLIRGGGQVLLFAHTKRTSGSASSSAKYPVAPKQGEGGFPLDLASVCLDEKDLIGSYSADFTIQDEVARLIFSRQFDMRKLITHRFPLEKTAEAVALASHPTEDSLKIVVTQTR